VSKVVDAPPQQRHSIPNQRRRSGIDSTGFK
jgi:hypothetical protein